MANRASIRTNLSTASLWAVAKNNDLAQLKDLMAKGVGIAARDEEGATIVHHAASSGAMDILNFVCGLRRADFLNIQDKHGQTAAFRAVSSNQPKAALFLVENGADPTIKSKNGLTCIARAESILGATYAQALQVAWETLGKAKNPEAAAAAGVAPDGSPMTKTDAKGLFQNKTDFRDPEEERRRKEQMAVDNEVELYLRGNDTRELTKRLALTGNPRVAAALLPSTTFVASNTGEADEWDVPQQPLVAVPVSPENYIDIDDLADAVSDFSYVALCITLNLNLESAAAITPKLNEALKTLAEQVKRVFAALQTYAQPFVLQQRNKIIGKAKGVQDSLKYCLESTKALNTMNNKETHQRLLNTTQLLVSDFCGFFFSCEQVYPEVVVEQVHFSESNIGQLLQLLDKRAAARPNQAKGIANDIRTTMKLIIGDTVRLNALVTARAFEKRDYEYQKQLSDACFFVTRAVKGINLLTEKLAAGAGNMHELREKVNTLTTAVSEQLSKIMSILHEPLRDLPPPVFDEMELQEMASRYQMAFKELNDAYLRYVESFQHWQETRTPPRAPADPEAPIPPDFAFTERRESVTLVKVILSNIGLIKEIFARPGPLELMKTTRSLAQSLSKFCANSFRVASDCNDLPLRELLMVSLQSTLLHNCHLKMITASKAMGYPLFLIEPSMLGTVRSLASILVVLLDASIEADTINQEQNINSSTEALHVPKLKILSFGRIICAPLPKAAPPNSKLEPQYSDPGPQQPEPVVAPDTSAGAAALNAASTTVQLPVSPLSNAVPAAAMARRDNPPKAQSKSERRAEDPQPTAPSAGPGSLRRDPKIDTKGKIVPEMAVNSGAKEELGPPPSTSDQDAYKAYMIKKYELQQRENAEILRKKKEAQ